METAGKGHKMMHDRPPLTEESSISSFHGEQTPVKSIGYDFFYSFCANHVRRRGSIYCMSGFPGHESVVELSIGGELVSD